MFSCHCPWRAALIGLAMLAAACGVSNRSRAQPAPAKPATPMAAVDPFRAPPREKSDPAGQSQPAPVEDGALLRGASPVEEDLREPASLNRWGPEASFGADARREGGSAIEREAFLPRRRFAVAIGIDNYAKESGFTPLSFAAGDAIAVAETLLTQAKFDQVLLIADRAPDAKLQPLQDDQRLIAASDVTRNGIRDQVEQFIVRANRFDDVLVFYFAGHGDSGRTAFLVPGDYDARTPKPLAVSEILEWMVWEPVRARNKLIILDACRSALNDSNGRVMAKAFRGALVQDDGRLTILTGCDANQSSFEDRALGHGRFTWALLDALRGNGYRAGEEHLLVSNLYAHVLTTFHERKWGPGQTPLQFTAGPVFSLAYRAVPKPPPLDEFEADLLRRAHEEAQKHYRAGDLERASAAFRFALRASGSTPLQDAAIRRIHGQLLLERALTVYRLGLKDEARELRTEGIKFSREAPVLLELEGYDLADAGQEREAVAKLEAAIERYADRTQISSYLWSRKATLEETLGEYSAATLSYGQAALASLRAGDRAAAERLYDQMRRIDFDLAWLVQTRLTGQPRFGLDAATASQACAQEIYGAEHWRTRGVRVTLDAFSRQSQLPWPELRTILELESLYLRLNAQDRDLESLAIAQMLSAIELEVHGPTHPWCANSLANIGRRLRDLGRYAEAALVYRRAVEIYRAHYGDRDPSTVDCRLLLSDCLRSADQPAAADETLQAALPLLDELLPRLAESNSAHDKSRAGQFLFRAKRYQEAAAYFATAASSYEASQQQLDAAWMRSWLGDCYRELKQDAAAVPIFQDCLARARGPALTQEYAIDACNLAKALYRSGRYEDSLPHFEAAAKAYAASGFPGDSAWMHDWAGDALRKLNRSREAIAQYDVTIDTFERLDRPRDRAKSLDDRAHAYYEALDYEQALKQFEQAALACDAAQLPITAAWTHGMQGLCCKKLGQSAASIAHYRESLDRFGRVNHEEDIAPIHRLLGQALAGEGANEEAIPHFEASAKINASRGRADLAAFDFGNVGQCLRNLNQEQRAIAAYGEGARICTSALSDPKLKAEYRASLLRERAKSLHGAKRYADGIADFKAAAAAFEQIGQGADVAWMHAWIGDCHVSLSQDEPAVAAYGESLDRFRQLDLDTAGYASVLSSLGQALYRLKKYPEAMAQFEQAAVAFERAKDPSEAAWALGWIGDCYRDLGDDVEALEIFQDCTERFRKLNDDSGLAAHATRLAGVLLRMNRNEDALAPCLVAAKAYERKKDEPMAARLYMEYGRTFQRLGRYEEALPVYAMAGERYTKLGDIASRAFVTAFRGQCLEYSGRDDEAREQYRQAIALFSQVDHQKDLTVLFRDYAKLLKAAERYEEAIVQFRAAAKEYERYGKPLDAAWMQDWIAGCYRDAGKDAEAAVAYQAALDTFSKARDQEGIAEEGYDLGQTLVRLKRHADAISPLSAAADANEKIDDPRTAAEVRMLLADSHLQLKQPEQSVKQYDHAFALYVIARQLRLAAAAAEQAGQALLRSSRKDDARRFLLMSQRTYERLDEADKAKELARSIAELDGE